MSTYNVCPSASRTSSRLLLPLSKVCKLPDDNLVERIGLGTMATNLQVNGQRLQ